MSVKGVTAAAPSSPRVIATSYRRGFSLCLPVRRIEDARRASGPRAVGDAATAAVVGGIVAIVMMDGVFAVLFFRLGI